VSGRDTVLITGLGPVGLGAALLCRALGARVVGVEGIPDRAAVARRIGVDHVLAPGDETLAELVELTGGHGFEVAIDCSGSADARVLCLRAAREWGRVALVGEGGSIAFEPSPMLIHKQLTMVGSWVCSIGQMEDLVELLARWQLHPEKTVTHRFALSDAREAYETFDEGRTGKVLITFEDAA
jgi:threonine dehydrogenase-like Zn-dependent dehydrogenase